MRGWLWLAAFVAVYDAWAGLTSHPTLSAEYRTVSREHPVPIVVGTAYLIAHLVGAVPQRIDPLSRYTRAFQHIRPKSIS